MFNLKPTRIECLYEYVNILDNLMHVYLIIILIKIITIAHFLAQNFLLMCLNFHQPLAQQQASYETSISKRSGKRPWRLPCLATLDKAIGHSPFRPHFA